MSLIRTSIVPVHIYTRDICPKKPIKINNSEHEYMVIPGINQGIKIDIPDIEFEYDLETKELMYKKDGGEWTPMGVESIKFKEDDKNGRDKKEGSVL